MSDVLKQAVRETIRTHQRLVERLQSEHADALVDIARRLADCIRRGGCILVCGNGGSAADAQHIVGELVGRFRRERRAFAAVALTTDTSVLTAVANDYDYESIFGRQVEALARPGDVLWALSTSGTAGNVLRAVQKAREKGCWVLAFTGRPQSPLERMADGCLPVEAPYSAPAQEVHQLAYHIVCDLVERLLTDEAAG